MSAIRLATAANVRGFHSLASAITTSEPDGALVHEALQDEIGRFRVWCGNIGALQKGHSSLDYRLRDSPLLSSNVLKLLAELQGNLEAAIDIVIGNRLPYEKQEKPKADEDEDDSFFSEDEDEDGDGDDDEPGAPKTELDMRFREVIDIIDNLYKLSVRIRQPAIRSRSLKAASYAPKDPETQVDILQQYAIFDLQRTQEFVHHLRMPPVSVDDIHEYDTLISRLARGVTLRRRQFKYWKRHRDKLGMSTVPEDTVDQPQAERPSAVNRHDTLEVQPGLPELAVIETTPSQKTGKSLLSGTEVTHHHQSLDDIVDSKSVTSYATTVRDASGRSIQLPPPPKGADGQKDFECPICYIICPARYANQRSWKVHVLQDLQPYVCTYAECATPDQLFQSRRQWVEHEASHRKAWRCPEHPEAVFKAAEGLGEHLRQQHGDSFPKSQLESIIKVSETSTIDLRSCPICGLHVESNHIGNHIANHLERIAAFALPTISHDDEDGASSQASRHTESTNSQDLSNVSFIDEVNNDESNKFKNLSTGEFMPRDAPERLPSSNSAHDQHGEHGLSAELLSKIPNSTQDRLERLFTQHPDGYGAFKEDASSKITQDYTLPSEDTDDQTETSPSHPVSADEDENDDEEDEHGNEGERSDLITAMDYETKELGNLPPIATASELTTLHSLYRTGKLPQRDATYGPKESYNQLISFCNHDITRLQVDAIVNSANRTLKISRPSFSLNHSIHKAAGPGLVRECKTHSKIQTGQAIMTDGYDLPCRYVIHVARPNYSRNHASGQVNALAKCYSNALKLAMERGVRTLAFPSIGSGGCGFPPQIAAQVALQEVRVFLDSHPSHSFQTIAFCVFSGVVEKAYINLLPWYFPPTHVDSGRAASDRTGANNVVLGSQVLEAYNQVEVVAQELLDFRRHVAAFPSVVLEEFSGILKALQSIETKLSDVVDVQFKPQNERTVSYINLICTVMQTVSGSITEIMELAKGKATLGQQSHQMIWNDYNTYMRTSQGLDVVELLEVCQDFVQSLEDVVVRNSEVPYEMTTMSVRLGSWLVKTTGRGEQGVRDHFEEVMYTREFQRDAQAPGRTDVVKLHQIPSISRLYQLGELKRKPTYSAPSTRLNHMLCLLRGDITQLEVDIIVNSTDPGFSGMGSLDSTVFKEAGPAMKEEFSTFGRCKEGDIKLTGAYQLPAKHVLHVIPPETYRRNSKDVLRKIYLDILHTAVSLKATSIALPAIGTGSLIFLQRDCATMALEVVKRFLESTESSSTIEKVVFCVLGSSDEFTYKSLLPIYFPAVEDNVNNTLPVSPPAQKFSSDNTARSVKLGKQPADSTKRPLHYQEEIILEAFEKHAQSCTTCIDVNQVYRKGTDLCERGYMAAQLVLRKFYMEADKTVFSITLDPDTNRRVQVEVPEDFSLCLELLTTVENSFRDERSTKPFVDTYLPWPGPSDHKNNLQLSPLASKVLTYLRDSLNSSSVHEKQLIEEFHVSIAVMSSVIMELQQKNLIRPDYRGFGVWCASVTSYPGIETGVLDSLRTAKNYKLSEVALVEMLQADSSSVHDVLAQLRASGLVQSIEGREGAWVLTKTPQSWPAEAHEDTQDVDEVHKDTKALHISGPPRPTSKTDDDLFASVSSAFPQTPTLKPRPNSPTSRPSSPSQAAIHRADIHINDPFLPFKALGDTHINSMGLRERVISPKALTEVTEEYEERGNEVRGLAGRTVDIRSGSKGASKPALNISTEPTNLDRETPNPPELSSIDPESVDINKLFAYVDVPGGVCTRLDTRIFSYQAVAETGMKMKGFRQDKEESYMLVEGTLSDEDVRMLLRNTISILSEPDKGILLSSLFAVNPGIFSYMQIPDLNGAFWTKIDRQYVNATAIRYKKLDFENRYNEYIIVRAKLEVDDMVELANLTKFFRHNLPMSPFRCSVCEYEFTDAEQYESHKGTHFPIADANLSGFITQQHDDWRIGISTESKEEGNGNGGDMLH
ncbi:hypothetical protein P280DRAFT_528457 [Massarina eburnea CBS 473.64]|uniref:Uncharacterized protein n=1 Tax=Massarina eburnea CBS 473.64 TaxID=1395130 RepID=A0A6A6RV21_9PLEO|nr:hypothetical protein P280DRAFT_528457 [Massarina eburnea CBS 473.64]